MVALLVISRDAKIVRPIRAAAVKNLWNVSIVPDVWDAMERLHSEHSVDILLVDLSGGNLDAARTIRLVRQIHPQLPFILIDRRENVEGDQRIQGERECAFVAAPLVESQLEGAIMRCAFRLHHHNGGAVKTCPSAPAGSPSSSMPSIEECKSLKSYLKNVREAAEKEAIAQTLEKTRWNRKAAARLLNVSYRSILYKIEEYRLSPPDHPLVTLNHSLESETTLSRGSNGSRLLRAYLAGAATERP